MSTSVAFFNARELSNFAGIDLLSAPFDPKKPDQLIPAGEWLLYPYRHRLAGKSHSILAYHPKTRQCLFNRFSGNVDDLIDYQTYQAPNDTEYKYHLALSMRFTHFLKRQPA